MGKRTSVVSGTPHVSKPRIAPRPRADSAPQRFDGGKSDGYIQSWLSGLQAMRAREPPHEPTPKPESPQLPYPCPGQSQPEPRKTSKRRREQLTPEHAGFERSEKADGYQFEKRARHKTRKDRYNYKSSGVGKQLAGEKQVLDPWKKRGANEAARKEAVKEQPRTRDSGGTNNSENPARRLLRSHNARRTRGGRGDDGELREFAAFFQHDDIGRGTSPRRKDNTANRERPHWTRNREESFSPSSVEQPQASHSRQGEHTSLNQTGRGRRDYYCEITPDPPVSHVPAQDTGRQGSISGSYITWSTSHREECEKNESEFSVSGGEQQSTKPRFERSRLGMKQHSDKDTRMEISHREQAAAETPILEPYTRGMPRGVMAESRADRQRLCAQGCWRESLIETDQGQGPPRYLIPQRPQRLQRSTGPSLSAPSQMRPENGPMYVGRGGRSWQLAIQELPMSLAPPGYPSEGLETVREPYLPTHQRQEPGLMASLDNEEFTHGRGTVDWTYGSRTSEEEADVYRWPYPHQTADAAPAAFDTHTSSTLTPVPQFDLQSMSLGEYIEHIEQEAALKSQWARGNTYQQSRLDRAATSTTRDVTDNSTSEHYYAEADRTADLSGNWRYTAHGQFTTPISRRHPMIFPNFRPISEYVT